MLGGPFLPHIEQILREKALSMSSPVVLASGSGNRSLIKGISESTARPSQSCDLLLQFDREPNLVHLQISFFLINFDPLKISFILMYSPMQSIELLDVRLSMLGAHQLQNAATATYTVLYLRSLGKK